jgi:glycosyltransferase involved in cell wall biosynthesis
MRILILDTRPLRRGAQIFAHDLSNGLKDLGFEVKKIYLYKIQNADLLTLNPQDEILGGYDRHIFEKIPTVHPFLLWKLIRRIRIWNPDLILLNGSRTLKYSAAARPYLDKRIKIIYRVIDSVVFWNDKPYKQFYYRRLIIPHIDAAIGVSSAALNDMKFLHKFNKPSVVIHRAIDPKNFLSTPDRNRCRELFELDAKTKVLVFLGNLTVQKRPDRFVAILKRVKQSYPDVKAWIVGDGILMKDIKELVIDEELADTVTFWGFQDNVGKFLSAADVLLLTSDTEGLPGVVLEAAYFRVPSVSSDVGGIKECINDGESGYIVSKENIDEFAAKVIRLLANDEHREEIGRAAFQKVIGSFTIGRITEKYVNFFSEICGRQL